ncbi:MAG: molybdenum cofactor biosynthesis protein MoaE [Saprospiraceae bacterium]|nr:molybdenum cofactor biosynthesis protein MoaE [Saprospiraceae bacterium]
MEALKTELDIRLTHEPLKLTDVQTWIDAEGVGGNCVFVGTVRNKTRDKPVRYLEFEAYLPMAESEMRKIGEQALERWPLIRVAIHHRVGHLEIGEIPVLIAVSSAHRDAAFAACRYCIDTLKETVPIWKKEVFEDGEEWVAAHP